MSTIDTKIPNLETQKRIADALETIAGEGLTKWNLEMNHPVGSTWESIYPNNPADILGGGTWKQLKDVTIVAAGDTFKVSDINTNKDGGEINHTLTVDEMPSHTHESNNYTSGFMAHKSSLSGTWAKGEILQKSAHDGVVWVDQQPPKTGGNRPHNNMPPHKVLYKWIRTA